MFLEQLSLSDFKSEGTQAEWGASPTTMDSADSSEGVLIAIAKTQLGLPFYLPVSVLRALMHRHLGLLVRSASN